MAEATVRWNVRAAGRDVGDVEVFDLDGVFAKGVVASGYVTVIPTLAEDEAFVGLVNETVDTYSDLPSLDEKVAEAEVFAEYLHVETNALDQQDVSDHPQSAESLGLVKPKPANRGKQIRSGE